MRAPPYLGVAADGYPTRFTSHASPGRCLLQRRFQGKKDALFIKAGKEPKRAFIAFMRKIVILANALLKKSKKWQQEEA